MPPATSAPRPPAAASPRLALALAISVGLLAGCGADRPDTPSEVSRYCERYRAYLRADERSTRETDPDRAMAASEAAARARAAVERATPPSLQDQADIVQAYRLMSGEDRSILENRLDYELAVDRIDAFRTDRCTLG